MGLERFYGARLGAVRGAVVDDDHFAEPARTLGRQLGDDAWNLPLAIVRWNEKEDALVAHDGLVRVMADINR